MLKYEKPGSVNFTAFLNTTDFMRVIMSEYIVVSGIRIATDFEQATFGRLTTIGPKFRLPYGTQSRRVSYQVCECTCGNNVVVSAPALVAGTTQSCGCFNKERTTETHTTHGKWGTPEYWVWALMKRRCFNPNNPGYPHYGGRGITVCERWIDPANGFQHFLDDMGKRPSPQHSIERTDVNGNYCLENCRWATTREQSRNKRSNIMLTHNGVTQCLMDWANAVGLNAETLRYRIKQGWPLDVALQPVPK